MAELYIRCGLRGHSPITSGFVGWSSDTLDFQTHSHDVTAVLVLFGSS